ncbi:hypothetical protein BIY24_08365 [Halobacteriovorax marinus]|uniref:hypothetical protein n=1 Tax=Halobacteriovorax marinus TaxID=97084 RepID=UPI000BC35A1F|nr:hypothetical protein [Halobacteriovorax marinus]ATH07963.1 hypothetical protein BIY24_08365 [Halobacteriovorax marinus]
MKKMLTLVLCLLTTMSFSAEVEIQECSSANSSTYVKLKKISKRGYSDSYILQELIVKDNVLLGKEDKEVKCKSRPQVLCPLEEGTVSLFLRSYTPDSGLIVYDSLGRSVDDVIGLECNNN